MTTFRRTTLKVLFALSLVPAALTGCSCHRGGAGLPAAGNTNYAAEMQQQLASPELAGMRWPTITDYQPQAQAFYTGRGNALAWLSTDLQPTEAAKQLVQLFDGAALKGLDPEDYDASRWPARVQRLDAVRSKHDSSAAAQKDIAQIDLAMTLSAMRYLADLHLGRVNPQALNFDIDVPAKRAAFDLVKLLNDQVLSSSDVATIAASVEPQNPRYQATEAALAQYLALAKQQDANPQPPLPGIGTAKPIDVGGTYPAVAALLTRLQLEGDATAAPPTTTSTATSPAIVDTAYTADLSAAVKHFQQRHGLAPDGKLGQNTLDALNVPLDKRVQSLDNALERWRWLPEIYDQPRVLVNLPEFFLRAYNADHALAFKMAVVDGEAKGFHDTPVFVRQMRYVVFRPYWNLPGSIIKKEIVPHVVRSGAGYLGAHGYEATTRSGEVVGEVSAEDLSHLRYAVRQRPGPGNSLGLVKFLFPNEYDVYMHSTPELSLFALSRRDRSHGCVRLQHADQMALWVLSGDQKDPETQTTWDLDGIHDAMNNEEKNNKTISLKTPLAVVITYMTAMADEDGSVHFFNDIYGYDKDLEAALAKGRPYSQAPAKINPTLVAGETE